MRQLARPNARPQNAAVSRSSESSGLWLAVGAALCFSVKAIFVKLAYPYGVGPIALLTLRMGFALPVFAVAAVRGARGATPLGARDLWALAGLGFIGYYAASVLDFLGLQYVTAGLERLILFTYPTLTLVFAVFAFGRPFDRRDLLALGMTWLGVGLAFAHDLDLSGDASAVLLGSGYVLLSAVCYAAYLAGAGEIVARVGSVRASAVASCVSALAVFAHFAATRPLSELAQPAEVIALGAGMGIICTVLPVFMLMAAIKRLGAARTAVVGTVGPVITIALGALLLDESISALQLAGTALVLFGVSLAGRPRAAGAPALGPARAR